MLPADAVMPVVPTATAVTVPPFTVATEGLLDVQVAVLVMSIAPLQVVACALICFVFCPATETLRGMVDAGLRVMDWIHPTVTVSCPVPERVGF
jgi:hypothetical protein